MLFQDRNRIFPVTPSVTTGLIPEYYGYVDALKVRSRIHFLIHDEPI